MKIDKRIKKNLLRMSLCIALSGAAVVSTKAQSKFHVDLDYHYNLGFSENKFGHNYGRSDIEMGGHSLRLGARYDVAEKWSVGGGIGLDHYTGDEFNTMPIYATLRYKPFKKLTGAYAFTDLGYAIDPSFGDFYKGFTGKLGVGYTINLAKHFRLNFQVAYDYKDFRNVWYGYISTDTNMPIFYESNATRHSLSLGVGVTF